MPEFSHILIVDDEKNMLVTLEDILEDLGYDISTASSGLLALEVMRTKTIDVVLMDYKMPGMNGVETFREIKKIDPSVKLIFITAYYEENIINEALAEGVVGICHKPLDIPHLIECIETATGKQPQV